MVGAMARYLWNVCVRMKRTILVLTPYSTLHSTSEMQWLRANMMEMNIDDRDIDVIFLHLEAIHAVL